jgi:protein-disulfide isomerase
MASRSEQKKEARARRIAAEQARAARERRQRRLRMLGGIALGAVAVVAVIVAISIAKGGSSGLQTGAKAKQTISQVQGLLSGIKQSGNTLGSAKAPVTLTYYGDLECPVCKEFTLSSFPQLISNEVRQGKVKVVYSAFETATQDPSVFATQQAAALAAGQQNRFWDYVELFYHEQGTEDSNYVNSGYLDGLAKQVPGLAVNTWQSARSSSALTAQVQGQEQSASSAGVSATPTLVFQGPKGKASPSAGVPTYAQLQQAIKQVQ